MKFIADSMLGSLAKWLRAAGFDVAYDPFLCDRLLLRRAKDEGRLLLTRDTGLVQVRDCPPHLFIRHDSLSDQLAQVVSELKLDLDEAAFFTRCLACNGLFYEVDKANIAAEVPPHVFATQSHFRRCPGCARIYWPGTHFPRLRRKLQNLLNSAKG